MASGSVPAHLLGDLVPHRLLALDPVGLLERRDVEEALAGRLAARNYAGVADQPVHEPQPGACDRGLLLVRLRGVPGHKGVGLQAALRGVGRHRAGRVPSRWHRQAGEPQLLRLRDRSRQAPGLERCRRVEPLVLDEQPLDAQLAAQALRGEQRREALAQADDVRLVPYRHHLEVPPHVGAAAFEGLPWKVV